MNVIISNVGTNLYMKKLSPHEAIRLSLQEAIRACVAAAGIPSDEALERLAAVLVRVGGK